MKKSSLYLVIGAGILLLNRIFNIENRSIEIFLYLIGILVIAYGIIIFVRHKDEK